MWCPPHRAGGRRRAEEHGRGGPRRAWSSPATTSAISSTSPPTARSARRSTTSSVSTTSRPTSWPTTSTPSTCRPSSPRSWTSRSSPCSTTTRTSRRAWSTTVRTRPVLGLAFDGLGYGTDGALWGGEALVAGFDGSERVGHLRPVVMPGGVAAIREPWRMAVAWAEAAGVAVRLDEPDQRAVAGLVEAGHGPGHHQRRPAARRPGRMGDRPPPGPPRGPGGRSSSRPWPGGARGPGGPVS